MIKDVLSKESLLSERERYRNSLFDERDKTLNELSEVTARINVNALMMNHELVDQNSLLNSLDMEIEREVQHMEGTLRKLARILRISCRKQLSLILWLTILMVVLLLLLSL